MYLESLNVRGIGRIKEFISLFRIKISWSPFSHDFMLLVLVSFLYRRQTLWLNYNYKDRIRLSLMMLQYHWYYLSFQILVLVSCWSPDRWLEKLLIDVLVIYRAVWIVRNYVSFWHDLSKRFTLYYISVKKVELPLVFVYSFFRIS